VGDTVRKKETLIAVIEPEDPSFHDIRTRSELQAAVAAAEASIVLTLSQVRRAEAELEFARSELQRARSLSERGTIAARTLEKAMLEVDVREAGLAQARANLQLRNRELESAKARLIGPMQTPKPEKSESCCVEVRAPESGRVLKIHHESEQIVRAGEPLLEIGDPQDLEIVVDLLSTDAVKVREGAGATIEGWGGDKELKAQVKRVDPAGFTKVSALGIEEQRVNTILDLADDPSKWADLGHDFRVFVRINVWSSPDTLTVPLSALFRHGSRWAVFRVAEGSARLTTVDVGQRNAEVAQVISGLKAGDVVILHPSDRVEDGVKVENREG
jgi:HlyD family secretion protein